MQEKLKWYKSSLGIIVLLILFFPIGLLLMWLYGTWNKKVKLAITAMFAFLVIAASNSPSNKTTIKQPVTAIVANETPTNTPIPSPSTPKTLEEQVKAQLSEGDTVSIVGANDLDTNETIPGKKQINITLNLGTAFWNTDAAKKAVWERTAKLTKNTFPLDQNIYALQITANMPTTDAYGKKDMTELELITMTRTTFNKIQWDNFDYKNIPTVADTYFENHNIK